MTEYDYTKWDKEPREMWVWNKDGDTKHKMFVVFIDADSIYKKPVLTKSGVFYEYCAEIEQPTRMTNYELAHWLWEGTQVGEFREIGYYVKNLDKCRSIRSEYGPYDNDEFEVQENVRIRVNGGEWKEPLIEE